MCPDRFNIEAQSAILETFFKEETRSLNIILTFKNVVIPLFEIIREHNFLSDSFNFPNCYFDSKPRKNRRLVRLCIFFIAKTLNLSQLFIYHI